MRIVHFSDTHLSPKHKHFQENWNRFALWLTVKRADFFIHTGDLSIDGADRVADLYYAQQLMHILPQMPLCVPGNHDVGSGTLSHQPINDERLARWRSEVGPDYWAVERDSWVLIGLNSLLCGTGHAEESKQLFWLKRTIEKATGKYIAVFTHKPLFIDDPLEGDFGSWTIPYAARRMLLPILEKGDLRLVASGHLHIGHTFSQEKITYSWAPSSAFVAGNLQEALPGRRDLGASIINLSDNGTVHVDIIYLKELKRLLIDDCIHEVYPLSARFLSEKKTAS